MLRSSEVIEPATSTKGKKDVTKFSPPEGRGWRGNRAPEASREFDGFLLAAPDLDQKSSSQSVIRIRIVPRLG